MTGKFVKTTWGKVTEGDTVLKPWPMPSGWYGHRIVEVTVRNVWPSADKSAVAHDFNFEGQEYQGHLAQATEPVYVLQRSSREV